MHSLIRDPSNSNDLVHTLVVQIKNEIWNNESDILIVCGYVGEDNYIAEDKAKIFNDRLRLLGREQWLVRMVGYSGTLLDIVHNMRDGNIVVASGFLFNNNHGKAA